MSWPILLQDNRFADGVPAASGTASGDPRNIADLRDFTFWEPPALPATLTVNCGVAKAVDAFGVFKHNLGSAGCTIELHGSSDNFVASDVTVATKTPASDKPFMLTFASVYYQYWRAVITGGATMPIIAMVIAGAAVYFPRGVAAGFDPLGRTTDGQSNNNDNGSLLGGIINYQGRSKTMNFVAEKTWLRSTFEPAWDGGLVGSPALLAWDNGNYPDEILHVRMGTGFSAPHRAGPYADLTLTIAGKI